jgi:hypothetical protein
VQTLSGLVVVKDRIITFFMTFFVNPLITASHGRFWVMAWVITGKNEVMKPPNVKILMTS